MTRARKKLRENPTRPLPLAPVPPRGTPERIELEREVTKLIGEGISKLEASVRTEVKAEALFNSEWVCLRCGEPKPVARRRIMTFFDHEGREDFAVALVVCVHCAGIFRACLERGTTLTPIVVPPDPVPKTLCSGCGARVYGAKRCAECEKVTVKPWET